MKAIWFGKHLYQPLLYLDTNGVEISSAPLNKGERQFVRCKACAPFSPHPSGVRGRPARPHAVCRSWRALLSSGSSG